MDYIEHFVKDEQADNLGDLFDINVDTCVAYSNICKDLFKATMQTDKLLDKRTTKGQLTLEILKACNPQTSGEFLAAFIVIKDLNAEGGMTPAMALLLKMMGGMNGDQS